LFLKSNSLDSSLFERLNNAMVYELYFPDEIKAAGVEVLKHLTNLPELKGEQRDDTKLAIIEKVYKELSDPKHPVSQAMFRMEVVEDVRIIEGKK
jgi:adenine-specific DNA-methyltransferase